MGVSRILGRVAFAIVAAGAVIVVTVGGIRGDCPGKCMITAGSITLGTMGFMLGSVVYEKISGNHLHIPVPISGILVGLTGAAVVFLLTAGGTWWHEGCGGPIMVTAGVTIVGIALTLAAVLIVSLLLSYPSQPATVQDT